MDKKKLAKNTIILGIGQLIPKIITLITLPILTKYLSVSGFGIYDLVISFSSLAIPIFSLLIQQGTFRFLISEDSDYKKCQYITCTLKIFLNMSLFWLTFLLLISIFNGNLKLYLIIFALYFFESLYNVFSQISRGFGRNVEFSKSVVIYSVINLFLLLFLMINNIVGVISVIIILSLSYFVSSIYLFCKLKINKYVNNKYYDKEVVKKLLKYSLPIIPSSISLWVVNLSDRLIITLFLGSNSNGIYAAANKIPNLFGTFYNVFNLAWTEIAAKSINNNKSNSDYIELLNNLFRFLTSCLCILIALSPLLFPMLINDKFAIGYQQIPILFLGVFFSCFVSFYGGLYIALKKTINVGISSLIGAVLNIIINVLLINYIGLYAASISTLISFFTIFVYRHFDLKKHLLIEYNKKDFIIGLVVIFIVILLFYTNTILSIIIAIIISIAYNLFNNFILFKLLKGLKYKISKQKTEGF